MNKVGGMDCRKPNVGIIGIMHRIDLLQDWNFPLATWAMSRRQQLALKYHVKSLPP